MTWPFENDTDAIIKKLAAAQLKKEYLWYISMRFGA